MLIPWASDDIRETIWAISHHSQEHFHREDYLLLKSLADFASIAVRHQRQEESLRRQAHAQACATQANQLSHQINNLLNLTPRKERPSSRSH